MANQISGKYINWDTITGLICTFSVFQSGFSRRTSLLKLFEQYFVVTLSVLIT